jgi:glycosyltransferase involved in cell wall biosynthesis
MKETTNTHPSNSSKLLVLCQLFYPELVSTGQTLTELCEQLAQMGVDVRVLCGPPTIVDRKTDVPKDLKYCGISIKRVWGTRFPKLNILGRMINQVTFAFSIFWHLLWDNSKRPILVLTNPPFLSIICAFFRIITGRPYIYLIFDVYPDTPIKLGLLKEKSFITRLWNLCNEITFRYSSRIIVIGRCMKEIITKKVGSKYLDKIHTIHVWSDDRLISTSRKENNPFINEWGLEGRFVVSYSGNMGRFHDMETIMEGVRLLMKYDDIVFLFIGEGHKKSLIMEYADKWQLTNCQFHTYVERENLGFSLACADVGLVSLSNGQEGLSVPSKTFGIMSAGVPVVAIMSSVSEIARILIEEECGVVVKPGDTKHFVDSILNLYNNRQKLKAMGSNAKKAIVSKYNLHAASKAYYDLLKEL